jgi:hypothetical protein
MTSHPVKRGEYGGRFQCSRGEKRYLLSGPIKNGPNGGHYQGSKSDPRYLLKYGKKR